MSSASDRVEERSSVRNGVARMAFTVFSILLEIVFIFFLIYRLNTYAEWINLALTILSVILVLAIYSQRKTSALKMPWIILIMAFPVVGVVLYLLIGMNGGTRAARKRYEKVDSILLPILPDHGPALERLRETDPARAGLASYVKTHAGYPLYENSDVTYYDDAARGLEAQKEELRKAESFIFMEYHAIEDRESWHGIQEILEDRVRAGVEVRVFYDDMGSIGFINRDFVRRMEDRGIRCRVFNPFMPGLNLFLNNRDHRKITVVDGRVAFTGGYNLANEYFNINSPFGHWKDTGVKIEGEAVRSLTVTFLEMWNAVRGDDENDTDFTPYLPVLPYTAREGGFVQPYADQPMDNEQVGEEVYISMAETAQSYVWFVTPYLILTDEMIHALGLAAKRGVDVRVITPGIPDKKLVYQVTRSYYNPLTRNGVKVYEYTPGFCHCKMCVADDKAAACGTINLDYRSLYHHFENGCLYYQKQAVLDTRADFESILAVSEDVTERYTQGRGAFLRLGQLILRLFAALL